MDALQALRGRRWRRWRWLLLGATVGFVAGAVVASTACGDQLLTLGTNENSDGIVAEKVRQTTASAREAAAKVRDRLPGTDAAQETASEQ